MTMAAIAAPVVPPTTPAIPATAKPDTLLSISGKHQFRAMPYAAPSVAPMTNAGEKIPPDAPGTECQGRGQQFQHKEQQQQVKRRKRSSEHVLDGGVSDSFNVIVAPPDHHEIHHDSDQKHPSMWRV